MYATHTETQEYTYWDAGMSSEKVVKDAFIAYIQSLPYTVVESDGYTFSYGGVNSFVPCYTKKGLWTGIKQLLGGNNARVIDQYNNWLQCPHCGHTETALCHRLPKSLGGTPTVNNIDYDCANCNGKHSNQIVKKCVRDYLKSKKCTLTYTVTTLV